MSCGRGGPSAYARKRGFGQDNKEGGRKWRDGVTLRRYAAQVWAQQRRHCVQHYNAELICVRFWSAGRTAFGVKGLDGARGCCSVECRCDVQSREGFLMRCLCDYASVPGTKVKAVRVASNGLVRYAIAMQVWRDVLEQGYL